MVRKQNGKIITLLDGGTQRIRAVMLNVHPNGANPTGANPNGANPDGTAQVLAFHEQPMLGMKRGVVANLDQVAQTIHQVFDALKRQSGQKVRHVVSANSASRVQCLNTHGVVPIRHQAVTQSDVDAVIDAARAVRIPEDQRILHILPQRFRVDDQDGLSEPVGMSGQRLEVKTHIITCAAASMMNAMNALQRSRVSVKQWVLNPLASAEMLLTEDEKRLGVALVDMGAGTTEVVVYAQGAVCHTAVIPLGGDQVTHDVAVALRTASQEAETLKCERGSLLPDEEGPLTVNDVVGSNSRQLPRHFLREVIQARYQELWSLVQAELSRLPGLVLPAGVVVCGGAVQIRGAVESAQQVLGRPVRLGRVDAPAEGWPMAWHTPAHATLAGLASKTIRSMQAGSDDILVGRERLGWWLRAQAWVQEYF